MRQKLITLDPTSWDRAQKKSNFSEWVRLQLTLESNGRTVAAVLDELAAADKWGEQWYQRYIDLVRKGEGSLADRDQEYIDKVRKGVWKE